MVTERVDGDEKSVVDSDETVNEEEATDIITAINDSQVSDSLDRKYATIQTTHSNHVLFCNIL